MLRLLKYGLLLCSAVTAVTAQQYNYKTTATGGSPNAPAPTAKNGVHTVLAGQNGIFTYNPDTLHVPVGDVVEFNFFPPNHSMAQASFNNPCHPMSANSIFAGYFPTSAPESNMVFSLTVNNTDPIWIYCPYLDDCQLGMVAVINPPAGNSQTLDMFRAAAKKASKSTAPAKVQGGIVSMEKVKSSSSSTSSSSSPSSTKKGDAPILRPWAGISVIIGLCLVAVMYVM